MVFGFVVVVDLLNSSIHDQKVAVAILPSLVIYLFYTVIIHPSPKTLGRLQEFKITNTTST